RAARRAVGCRAVGCRAGRLGGGGAWLARGLALGLLLREQRQCLGERDLVGVGPSAQRGNQPVMADIGPVAAAIEPDRAAVGMRAEFAQQLRAAPAAGLGL